MANDKAAPPAPAAEAPAKEGAKKGAGMKMAIAAVVVLALEGGTIGVTMKMAGGPQKVTAEVPVATQPAERDAEIELIDAKLPNGVSGRLYVYDLAVVIKVAEKKKPDVTNLCNERKAEIRDQVRTIIASSDPKSLAEPGLETIKRQIGYQLEQDIGKDLIKEVLIPKCTAIPVQ
jgi:flagellar basal body-associated protein FliL